MYLLGNVPHDPPLLRVHVSIIMLAGVALSIWLCSHCGLYPLFVRRQVCERLSSNPLFSCVITYVAARKCDAALPPIKSVATNDLMLCFLSVFYVPIVKYANQTVLLNLTLQLEYFELGKEKKAKISCFFPFKQSLYTFLSGCYRPCERRGSDGLRLLMMVCFHTPFI